ncbi:MAG: S-layer homology domain-containing protein [Promicromonosporaceae bacterium]|nr:S-layer homology domain-containing protein [Promicromonosporaceae bacterium]
MNTTLLSRYQAARLSVAVVITALFAALAPAAAHANTVPTAEYIMETEGHATSETASGQRFSDVPRTHPFHRQIEWMAEMGITTGYGDGTFRPGEPVSRQAMAAFIYRATATPGRFNAPATATFGDVPRGSQFHRYVEWMNRHQITTGHADRTFRPTAPVERQAMAAFLFRAAGCPTFNGTMYATFTDVGWGGAFHHEIEWLRARGITTGHPDGTYRPTQPVTREAMAAFIYRAYTLGFLDGNYNTCTQPAHRTVVPPRIGTPEHNEWQLTCPLNTSQMGSHQSARSLWRELNCECGQIAVGSLGGMYQGQPVNNFCAVRTGPLPGLPHGILAPAPGWLERALHCGDGRC